MAWTNEQNLAIYESGKNIIVSAGAGSGKTAVLSERVLEKVLSGTHINELLILTFTKAAAEEMKDRIRRKISSKVELKDEVNLLDSAYITTFDSYALSVVSKYHYLLNISSNVSITDESIVTTFENKIIDEVFEDRYKNRDEKFLSFIRKNCLKNDKRIRYYVLDIIRKVNKNINKKELLDFIDNEYFSDININKILLEYYDLLEKKVNSLRKYLEDASYYFDEDYVNKLYESCYYLLNSSTDKLYLVTKIDLPRLKNGSSDEQKEYKELIKRYCNEIINLLRFGSKENIKEDLLKSKDDILCIVSLIRDFNDRLDKLKRENNIYTFMDVASLAIKVVSENEEVRNEIKYSFKEIMIDEYQDTNDIQDKFISLIMNDNVYMVGDIKQSIYRFNGSNPSIFKDKYDRYSNNNGGYKIDLIKNFRSRSEVLNGINDLFNLLMDDYIGGCDYIGSHNMEYGNTNYDSERDNLDYSMEINLYETDENKEYKNCELEIFSIVKDIKNKMSNNLMIFDKDTNKMRKATYSDFVIILDRSTHFDEYKKIFEYNGIPLTILKNEKLTSGTEINLIRNIFDIIIRINKRDFNEEFRYDFISIARSFLYEINDEEIFKMFKNNTYKDSIVYKNFENICSFDSITSGDLFLKILDITDYYNKLYKIGDYENIDVKLNNIYNLSKQFNNLGYSIYDFKNYLDEVIENNIEIQFDSGSSNSDSVKIMTIHKSKGLEYPICYFADLDHEFNLSDARNAFSIDKKYGIMIPSESEDAKSGIVKELFYNSFIREEISEKIRLLYVALTRAREKIIIYLPNKDIKRYSRNENGTINDEDRMKYMKLSDMLYTTINYLNEYVHNISFKDIPVTKNYLYKKSKELIKKEINSDILVKEINIFNEEISSKHFSHENNRLSTKEEINNMKFGTKIHEILEYIDFKNYDSSNIKDVFIRNKIDIFMKNSLLSNINEANIYHEYEFIYEKDNNKYHGIIDLMLEYDSYIDIIDYKLLNVSSDSYKEQLNGYKKYIENVSKKEVNIYLYSILDGEFTKL